jgi:hypothetical protein
MAADKDAGMEALATILAKQNDTIAMIGAGLMALKESQPPREVQYGDPDYQAKLKAERREWRTPTYQNGYEADPSGESWETIERTAQLKAGRYLNGSIEVLRGRHGEIYFRYANKHMDQRFARNLEFRKFGYLVDQIWAEMQAREPATP